MWCAFDDGGERFFCPTCWELPTRIERPFCSQCGRLHPRTVGFGVPENYPCENCNAKEEARPYRHVFGATVYEETTAEAVKILKFHERRWIVQPMVDTLR